MQLAVLSDVHGNQHALEAVLNDIEARRPDLVVVGGDLVGYGAFPNEVIDRIRSFRLPVVRGNYDQGVGNDLSDCGCAYTDATQAEWGRQSLEWTKQTVTNPNRSYLSGLPDYLRFRCYNRNIMIVHGSPRRINEYLYADRPDKAMERMLQEESLAVLICGHTHLPYTRPIGSGWVINSGSVGKPKDGDSRAGYALISIGPSSVEAVFPRISYDVEAAAAAIEKAGLPGRFAQDIRTGGKPVS